MEESNQLAFETHFNTEDQAQKAALLISDLLEAEDKVSFWSMDYGKCPDCGNHAYLKGTITTLFAGQDLLDVGIVFAETTRVQEGFIVGDVNVVKEQEA
jgi:hypothetical protein